VKADLEVDAIIIGGGFYGSVIALYLAKKRNFSNVIIIETESGLLKRASYNNQARVHNGYHYPRSFTTSYRSRVNFPKFLKFWPKSIKKDFCKLYAISSRNSKITSNQFIRFCNAIGAEIKSVDFEIKKKFNPHLIENVFEVKEYAFDSSVISDWANEELQASNVKILFNHKAVKISKSIERTTEVEVLTSGNLMKIRSKYVFNCTYSGLKQIFGLTPGVELNHELTEMALLEMPQSLKNFGVTVMDGPFFSFMPFPAEKLHSFSHVRYTPHFRWKDSPEENPYEILEKYNTISRFNRMIRDASRYMPLLSEAIYKKSLFEIKTILSKNDGDDGRPILFEKHTSIPGCFSILGGKIDNIFDIIEKLDKEDFPLW